MKPTTKASLDNTVETILKAVQLDAQQALVAIECGLALHNKLFGLEVDPVPEILAALAVRLKECPAHAQDEKNAVVREIIETAQALGFEETTRALSTILALMDLLHGRQNHKRAALICSLAEYVFAEVQGQESFAE